MQKLTYIVAFAAIAACSGGSSEPAERAPAELQILFNGVDFGGKTISGDATMSFPLATRVLDGAGIEMAAPAAVHLVSRDTSKVVVDAAGLVTARVPGGGLIVARLSAGGRELTDSVGFSFACTAAYLFGLSVSFQDSVTGTIPSVASNWRVRDVAGTFADSGRTMGFFFSAGERAGTYRIDVTTPGYRDWTANGVIVTRDQCHVKNVAVTVRLQRAP